MKEGEKNFVINISAGTIVKAIIIVALFALLFYLRDLVLIVLTSVVVASSIEPATLWFAKFKVGRIPAVIITYALIFTTFVGIFFFFVPSLLNETSNFLSTVPAKLPVSQSEVQQSQKVVSTLEKGLVQGQQLVMDAFSAATTKETTAVKTVAPAETVMADYAPEDIVGNGTNIINFVNKVREVFSSFPSGFVNTVSGVFGSLLGFILIVVLSFYLAVQEGGIEKFLRLLAPAKNEAYVISLWKRTQKKIGLWMQGQVLLAVLVGVLVYLGLTVLGIKNALMLAFVAAIFEIIPLFGPILSAIPGIAFGYASGGITLAIVATGLYIIIQQFENHLIYPLVVKKIVGVSPILVILSLLVGWEVAGFLGLLISVPVVTAIMEYLDDIQESKNKAKEVLI